MIELAERIDCTGCGACEAACRFDALTMMADSEGFLRPVIDEDKCTSCQACTRACPVVTELSRDNFEVPDIYALKADEETREMASSGGVFPLLARRVLADGGYVCGVVFDDDYRGVHHAVSNDEDVVRAMSSSKYVQSDMGNAMGEVMDLLIEGKDVLFSGCPCQVAGMKRMAENRKHTGRLYTMDFFCHGVPSPAIYEKYIDELVEKYGKGGKLEKFDFRDKSVFGWSTCANAYFDNGEEFHERETTDPYYRLFLPCAMQRPSCSVCRFSSIPRIADISVGDFWGCENHEKSLNDGRGTSFALVNSETGREMFDAVRDGFELVMENVPLDAILPINPTPIRPFRAHPARSHVFASRNFLDMRTLADHALAKKYDVAIAGLWYGRDYGSILMPYAIYQAVGKLGYDPILLDKPAPLWDESFNDPDSVAHRFIDPRCAVAPRWNEIWEERAHNSIANTFIVGPDVVWNHGICASSVDEYFFLDFVSPCKKKIAYDASLGFGFDDYPRAHRHKATALLKTFDAVFGADEAECGKLAKMCGHFVEPSCPPLMLVSGEEYAKLAKESPAKFPEKFVMTDISVANPFKADAAKKVAETLSVPLVCYKNLNAPAEAYEELGLAPSENIQVVDWLKAMCECDFAVVDSLYGLSAAIATSTPFVVIASESSHELLAMSNLLDVCSLSERLVWDGCDDAERIISGLAASEIDWNHVSRAAGDYVRMSLGELAAAIEFVPERSADYIYMEELFRENYDLYGRIYEMNKREEETSRIVSEMEGRLANAESLAFEASRGGTMKRAATYLKNNGVGSTIKKSASVIKNRLS